MIIATLSRRILVICSVFVLLCWSCKNKDEQQTESPEITDLEMTDITDSSAKCTFSINLVGKVEKAGVIYSTDYSLSEGSPEISTTSVANGNISLTLTGLNGYTYYYYKAFITTSENKTIYSDLFNFLTDSPPLEVTVSMKEVSYVSGVFQFNVLSKNEWTITSNQSWCTVQPAMGSGNGEITVSMDENLTGASRSATLTVTAGSLSRQVKVEQSFPTMIATLEPEMVFVQGGTFVMGCSSENDNDCYEDEIPDHQVTVSDFYISIYETTQLQWKVIMDNNPSSFIGDSLPVDNVSWSDVQLFIRRLNNLTGMQYRLPTEAEWEFAARGGSNSKGYLYSGSNAIDAVAWYWLNIPSQTMGNEGYGTQPVGTKSPNELGLYDMSGNVFEWCNDWYGEYSSITQTDPAGPLSGDYRVARGGSWNSNTRGVSLSYRGFIAPDDSYNYLGFRLVCPPQ